MSEGATIKIDGDASGFIAATEESRKAASGMSEALQGAVGGSTGEAVKGLKGMDQEGRKACKRLNAGLINMSATITGVGAAINGLRAGWGKFSGCHHLIQFRPGLSCSLTQHAHDVNTAIH